MLLALAGRGSTFSETDVECVKAAIREEYSRREGGTVADVRMVKEPNLPLRVRAKG
jgi:hypothetical protein